MKVSEWPLSRKRDFSLYGYIHRVSKPSLILSFFPPQKRKVALQIQYKSTRTHRTRAYVKKKMASVEQESVGFREEIGNLK